MKSLLNLSRLLAIFVCFAVPLLPPSASIADEFIAAEDVSDGCGNIRRVVDKKICGKLLCFCGSAPDGPKSFKGTAKDKAECQKICGREAMESYQLETPTAGGEYTDNCDKLDHDPMLSTGAPTDFKCPEGCRPVRTGPMGLYQGYGSGCCLVKTIWECKKPSVFSRPSEVVPQ